MDVSVVSAAAYYGSLEILQWLLNQKIIIEPQASKAAAKGGQPEILKWLEDIRVGNTKMIYYCPKDNILHYCKNTNDTLLIG